MYMNIHMSIYRSLNVMIHVIVSSRSCFLTMSSIRKNIRSKNRIVKRILYL